MPNPLYFAGRFTSGETGARVSGDLLVTSAFAGTIRPVPRFSGPYVEWDTRVGGRERWAGLDPPGGSTTRIGYRLPNIGTSGSNSALTVTTGTDNPGVVIGPHNALDLFTKDGPGAGSNSFQNEWQSERGTGDVALPLWAAALGPTTIDRGVTFVAFVKGHDPLHSSGTDLLANVVWQGGGQLMTFTIVVEPGTVFAPDNLIRITGERSWDIPTKSNGNALRINATWPGPPAANPTADSMYVVATNWHDPPLHAAGPEDRNAWWVRPGGAIVSLLDIATFTDIFDGYTHDNPWDWTAPVNSIRQNMDIAGFYDKTNPVAFGIYPTPQAPFGSGNARNPNPDGQWGFGFCSMGLYRGFPTTADLLTLYDYYAAATPPTRPVFPE